MTCQVVATILAQRVPPISWDPSTLNVSYLKKRFRELLEGQKQIRGKDDWMKRAISKLGFDSPKICRFVLLMVSQDTMPDKVNPGLIKLAAKRSTPTYLNPAMWHSKDLNTIEHVAPQKPPNESDWDANLYEDEAYQQIGNLVLLPLDINASASNKDWKSKYIYYMHLAEKDISKISNLALQALQNNLILQQGTLDLLQNAQYNNHLTSVIEIGINGKWDKSLIDARTKNICEILWIRLWEWLN